MSEAEPGGSVPADPLETLLLAFGPDDGRRIAESWRAAFVHFPAIGANLRALADAPVPEGVNLERFVGARDLALTLLRLMKASQFDIEDMFNTGNADHDRADHGDDGGDEYG